jgi:hypothetical protein
MSTPGQSWPRPGRLMLRRALGPWQCTTCHADQPAARAADSRGARRLAVTLRRMRLPRWYIAPAALEKRLGGRTAAVVRLPWDRPPRPSRPGWGEVVVHHLADVHGATCALCGGAVDLTLPADHPPRR